MTVVTHRPSDCLPPQQREPPGILCSKLSRCADLTNEAHNPTLSFCTGKEALKNFTEDKIVMLRYYRDRSWLDAGQNRHQRTTPDESLLKTGNGMFHSEDSPTELRVGLKDITCLAALINTAAKSYI